MGKKLKKSDIVYGYFRYELTDDTYRYEVECYRINDFIHEDRPDCSALSRNQSNYDTGSFALEIKDDGQVRDRSFRSHTLTKYYVETDKHKENYKLFCEQQKVTNLLEEKVASLNTEQLKAIANIINGPTTKSNPTAPWIAVFPGA